MAGVYQLQLVLNSIPKWKPSIDPYFEYPRETKQSLTADFRMAPVEIKIIQNGQAILVSWPDGTSQQIPALTLRSKSRSARSLSKRIKNEPDNFEINLTIENVSMVGSYAINVKFSDGYDKGVFPWNMLREITSS